MHELGQARSGNGEVVRTLVSHCCGSGSIHGLVVTFGLSLLWVLVLALALAPFSPYPWVLLPSQKLTFYVPI